MAYPSEVYPYARQCIAMKGKDKYQAVQNVERKILNQGKWRKKGNKITQAIACKEIGISTYQYRKWKNIIDNNKGKPVNEIYIILEDNRHAHNKLTQNEEQVILDYVAKFPKMSYRSIGLELQKHLGRQLHHNTVKRVIKK